MEAFEQFVALALEVEGFVVSPAVKFDVRLPTKKEAYREIQRHGYEVDLVAARSDRLVLATVKSFFGSQGVVADHVKGTSTNEAGNGRYKLLNNRSIRTPVIAEACKRFGYKRAEVELRLYAGRFAGPTQGKHEEEIRRWCSRQKVGAGPIGVFGLKEITTPVIEAAAKKQYRDNPVLVTLKVLEADHRLVHDLPDP